MTAPGARTILGLTGSFGSGKTTVAQMLREAGAVLIDADAIAREVVAPGTPALAEIGREFGPAVLAADGSLDRAGLARLAFANREATRRLNAIIHPRVRAEELRQLAQHEREPLVVLDVPLLLEGGMRDLCDRLAVVVIGERERFARLRRRGFGEQQVIARLARQWPQSRKAAAADYVIDNSGTLAQTHDQVYRMLQQLAQAEPGHTGAK